MSLRMIRTPWSRVVWGPCLLRNAPVPGRGAGGAAASGLSLLLQTALPPGSHRCPGAYAPDRLEMNGADPGQRSRVSPASIGGKSPRDTNDPRDEIRRSV